MSRLHPIFLPRFYFYSITVLRDVNKNRAFIYITKRTRVERVSFSSRFERVFDNRRYVQSNTSRTFHPSTICAFFWTKMIQSTFHRATFSRTFRTSRNSSFSRVPSSRSIAQKRTSKRRTNATFSRIMSTSRITSRDVQNPAQNFPHNEFPA